MNTDLSVAPEIAQLAAPFVPPPQSRAAAAPRTDGRLAGELSRLAAAPQRWWDLVRFDAAAPVRIPVPGAEGAWLLVLPPGAWRTATAPAPRCSPARPSRGPLRSARAVSGCTGSAPGTASAAPVTAFR